MFSLGRVLLLLYTKHEVLTLHKFFYPRQITQNEFLHKVNVVKKPPKYSLYVDFEILILTSPHLAGKNDFDISFEK